MYVNCKIVICIYLKFLIEKVINGIKKEEIIYLNNY